MLKWRYGRMLECGGFREYAVVEVVQDYATVV